MDSFTQIVLGAAVGEAVLGKKIGNKAMLWGAIGGTIPDLDVLGAPFMNDITALAFHRGISHSLIFGLLFPFVVAWLPHFIHRQANSRDGVHYKHWVYLFMGAIITHPLLDAFTSYGTQLFLPFSDYRVAFNTVSIVDPLYTLPFLICLIAAAFYNRTNTKRRFWNWLGIGLSCSYLLYTVCIHRHVHTIVDKNLMSEQVEYSRYSITPTLFNSSLWNVIVESEEYFTLGLYSIWDDNPVYSDRIEIDKNHELARPIKSSDEFKILKWFTDDYYVMSRQDDHYQLSDIRYGRINPDEAEPKFVFTFNLKPKGKSVEVEEIRAKPDNPTQLLKLIWSRMWGK